LVTVAELEDSPAPAVPPCDDDFYGRMNHDWCRSCRHALAVHRADRVCSVCDALAVLRAELRRELGLE
jgi:hypothetical protein